VIREGRVSGDFSRSRPCGHVVVRNNTLIGCQQAVALVGAIHKVHVVGNRITDTKLFGIDLIDLLPGSDILLANNTLLRSKVALRILDDHSRGKDFLKCKSVRFENNLVLETLAPFDLALADHPRGKMRQTQPGDLQALLDCPAWRFSHNWRERPVPKGDEPPKGFGIPKCPNDRLQPWIEAGSRRLVDANFLQPPEHSPLGAAGVGDGTLPRYVGAIPPKGVEPRNWDKTWIEASKKDQGK
jgi:hypothetical protein